MVDITTLNSFSQSVVVLLAVVILKAIVGQWHTAKPLAFFSFYCQQLAAKVNRPQNSISQQKVAGLVSVIITLAPLIVILWLFEAFIEVPWLWQAVLLYFALGSCTLGKLSKTISQQLQANQKYQAKQTLSPWVLRDTEQLSPLGICKATIEMRLHRGIQEYICVSLLFLVIGPIAAMSYRLLLLMHYCWNIKHASFTHFGKAAATINNAIQWLPARVVTIMILLSSLGSNFLLNVRLTSQYLSQFNNNAPLAALAYVLAVKLGGVAMYNKTKVRKASFNEQARQPEPQDILSAHQGLTYVYIMLTMALMLFTLMQQLVFAQN